MSEKRKFVPKWPSEHIDPGGLFYPDNIEERTLHPQVIPQGVTEFHAWKIDETGKASPWPLPKEVTFLDGAVSFFWSNLENGVFEEEYAIKTFRIVSWDTLERH